MANTSEDGQHVWNRAKNPVLHDKIRHFEVCHHNIRECVETWSISLDHVSTQNQLADVLMKPLGGAWFSQLRGSIGVEEMVDEH
jgi:hypothetical protein